jgi:hypothetical protein
LPQTDCASVWQLSASDVRVFCKDATLPQARSIRSTPSGVMNSERAVGVSDAVGHEKRRIAPAYPSEMGRLDASCWSSSQLNTGLVEK